jgi:hypothetical protein
METEYHNVTDVFLEKAAREIVKQQFEEAANFIVLAITEFDDQTDIPEYLSYLFKTMEQDDIECLIVELSKEMMWRCPQPYTTELKRKRIVDFKNQATPLFEKYGFVVASDADCEYVPDNDEQPNIPTFMFALKKKKNIDHPH